MFRRFCLLSALIASAAALAATGCSSGTKHSSASSKHAAKHLVLRHASLAVGAFHRFIVIPARAGELSDPVSQAARHGAAAALFAYRQLKIAAHNAQHGKGLKTLFAPLEVTADKLKALASALLRGPSGAEIRSIHGIMRRLSTIARASGHRIVDATPAQIAAAGGPRA